MIGQHGGNHGVALFIKFYANVLDVFVFKFTHQWLKFEALRATIRVRVPSSWVLFPMAGRIEDVEHLLGASWSPVLVKAFSLPTNNILWEISSPNSSYSRNKSFELSNVICKFMNSEPLSVTMVPVSDEADPNLEPFWAVNDILNDLLESGFGPFDPGAHGAGAVQEKTQL